MSKSSNHSYLKGTCPSMSNFDTKSYSSLGQLLHRIGSHSGINQVQSILIHISGRPYHHQSTDMGLTINSGYLCLLNQQTRNAHSGIKFDCYPSDAVDHKSFLKLSSHQSIAHLPIKICSLKSIHTTSTTAKFGPVAPITSKRRR